MTDFEKGKMGERNIDHRFWERRIGDGLHFKQI